MCKIAKHFAILHKKYYFRIFKCEEGIDNANRHINCHLLHE